MIQILKMMVKFMVTKGSYSFNIGLIRTTEEVVLPTKEDKVFGELESSNVPLEGTLAHLHHTMQEITEECTQGGVTFCDHATLIMKVLA
jgi:hypothetical protein